MKLIRFILRPIAVFLHWLAWDVDFFNFMTEAKIYKFCDWIFDDKSA